MAYGLPECMMYKQLQQLQEDYDLRAGNFDKTCEKKEQLQAPSHGQMKKKWPWKKIRAGPPEVARKLDQQQIKSCRLPQANYLQQYNTITQLGPIMEEEEDHQLPPPAPPQHHSHQLPLGRHRIMGVSSPQQVG